MSMVQPINELLKKFARVEREIKCNKTRISTMKLLNLTFALKKKIRVTCMLLHALNELLAFFFDILALNDECFFSLCFA